METVIVLILSFQVASTANPVFTVPGSPGRSVPIPETTPAGTSVYRVVAVDTDNDVIIYSITSQRPTTPSKFGIVSTSGVISTLSGFDVDGTGSVDSYEITIRATDGASSVQTTLVIKITDINDNSPVFQHYHVIRENTKPGAIVANVLAEDIDSNDNGKVNYRITGGNDGGEFGIDSSNGVLYTMGSLEYDTKSTYILQIEARDSATTSRSTTMTLTLSLMEHVGNGSSQNCLNRSLLLAAALTMTSLFMQI